jgi:hypothetical protein
MEVQPDIQQRSGLDQASSLGASSACLPTPDVCGLQLIQRSEPKVGQHCPRTDPLHLLLVIVIILCVHLRLTTYGVDVDCGVALPYARLVDPCLCSHLGNIQGVLDLL